MFNGGSPSAKTIQPIDTKIGMKIFIMISSSDHGDGVCYFLQIWANKGSVLGAKRTPSLNLVTPNDGLNYKKYKKK